MKAWAIVESGQPLELLEFPTPVPQGSEVLVEVTHAGVCHSDLHLWKGEYNLGGGKVLKLSDRGVVLPRAPGHEIAGKVVAFGPDATGVAIGDQRVVYPWLGCGECPACHAEEDNMCLKQRSLGVVQHGGFGSHVVVPHPRYLVDAVGVDPALGATYACSGITTYNAISKVLPLSPSTPVVLIGAGGVGLMAIAMLQALGHEAIFTIDIAADKRAAAEAAGATAIDGAADGLVERVFAATGGPVAAVFDFVNNSATAANGMAMLDKGGKLVMVGVSGGELTLSLAGMVFRAYSVLGSNTGSLKDLRAVVKLAQEGKLKPTPVTLCSKDHANEALLELKAGHVTGRTVLV
jgi:alcohol dehydrogenase/propanol-preferring alcohol dehydrogenase